MKKKIVIFSLLFINIVLYLIYYQTVVNNKKEIIEEFVIIETKEKNEKEQFDIEIYYPSANYQFLEKDILMLDKDLTKEEKIIEIFNKLKYNAEIIPIGSDIRNIFFEGKKVYLNFNAQISKNMTTPEKELLIIYMIVNSITNLEDIDQIKFLIENREIEFIGKFIKTNDFFKRDNLLIQGE